MSDSDKLLELYRTDFASFTQRAFYELYPDEALDWNWHHDAMIDCLLEMRAGNRRRQLSDTTARSWLQGRASPSSLNLVALAAHSGPVLKVILRLTGNGDLELGLKLRDIEESLVQALAHIRSIAVDEHEPM